MTSDPVNHPAHYTAGRKHEAYEVIEDWFWDNYNLGQVLKYLARAGRKDPEKLEEDLRKGLWYLEAEIKRVGKANAGR